MNKHILIGRITKDLELEHLGEKQTARVRFDLAVNRKYRNSKGEFDTDFFHCVAFRTTAENIVKYFKKGSLIGLEGSMQNDRYEKDGNMVDYWQYHAETFEFCGSNRESGEKSDEPKLIPVAEQTDLPF